MSSGIFTLCSGSVILIRATEMTFETMDLIVFVVVVVMLLAAALAFWWAIKG